uniref:Uncharacterized protein n=1 Tax=viral metagenome TaxID=1070528 RepID=A0A6M3L410_9ZZZZ
MAENQKKTWGAHLKSVTIKQRGVLLLKIIRRKSGKHEIVRHRGLADIDIDVRDDGGQKIHFQTKDLGGNK